jgi:hypothetical protein
LLHRAAALARDGLQGPDDLGGDIPNGERRHWIALMLAQC